MVLAQILHIHGLSTPAATAEHCMGSSNTESEYCIAAAAITCNRFQLSPDGRVAEAGAEFSGTGKSHQLSIAGNTDTDTHTEVIEVARVAGSDDKGQQRFSQCEGHSHQVSSREGQTEIQISRQSDEPLSKPETLSSR